jgi:hypothetical protein
VGRLESIGGKNSTNIMQVSVRIRGKRLKF